MTQLKLLNTRCLKASVERLRLLHTSSVLNSVSENHPVKLISVVLSCASLGFHLSIFPSFHQILIDVTCDMGKIK